MKQIFKTLFILCGFALMSAAFAAPSAQEAPDDLVKRITREVMDTVRHDSAIQAGDPERIREVINSKILPYVDVRRATSIAIGRHWREATPQQQEQLVDEFRALLMHTYAGAMSQIRDRKVVFQPMRDDPDDTEAEVRFLVERRQRGEMAQVSYRLHLTPEGWKVYDVNVLGVWLVQTYKSTFAAEIDKSGIDGLIRTLQEKNRTLAAQTAQG
jgi:phospholipid transport system substrate-binding protein